MKKILTVLCIVIFAIALLGCGGSGINKENYEKIEVSQTMKYEQVVKILGAEGEIIEENIEEKTQKYLWENKDTKDQIKVSFRKGLAYQASFSKGKN